MGILSVDVPAARVGLLNHTACVYGVQSEGVVNEEWRIPLASPHYATVDLVGEPYRLLTVALRSGGTPVHYEKDIPHGEAIITKRDPREGR